MARAHISRRWPLAVLVLSICCGDAGGTAAGSSGSPTDGTSSSSSSSSNSSDTSEASSDTGPQGRTIEPDPACEAPGPTLASFTFEFDGASPLTKAPPVDFTLALPCSATTEAGGAAILAECFDAKGIPHDLRIELQSASAATLEFSAAEMVRFEVHAELAADAPPEATSVVFEVRRGVAADAPLIVAGAVGAYVPQSWFDDIEVELAGPEPCPLGGPTYVDETSCSFRQARTLALSVGSQTSVMSAGTVSELGGLRLEVGAAEDSYRVADLYEAAPGCAPEPLPAPKLSFLAFGPS